VTSQRHSFGVDCKRNFSIHTKKFGTLANDLLVHDELHFGKRFEKAQKRRTATVNFHGELGTFVHAHDSAIGGAGDFKAGFAEEYEVACILDMSFTKQGLRAMARTTPPFVSDVHCIATHGEEWTYRIFCFWLGRLSSNQQAVSKKDQCYKIVYLHVVTDSSMRSTRAKGREGLLQTIQKANAETDASLTLL
jgi:hypothetical protein